MQNEAQPTDKTQPIVTQKSPIDEIMGFKWNDILLWGCIFGGAAWFLWQYPLGQTIVIVVMLVGMGILGALSYEAVRLWLEKREYFDE